MMRKAQGKLYNPRMIEKISFQFPSFVGQGMNLVNIGGIDKFRPSESQFQAMVQALKFQTEESTNLDEYIVMYGHKALGYYKYRS